MDICNFRLEIKQYDPVDFFLKGLLCQRNNREFKHDVYGRRQTAKVNSNFLFFSCNPYINHTKIK